MILQTSTEKGNRSIIGVSRSARSRSHWLQFAVGLQLQKQWTFLCEAVSGWRTGTAFSLVFVKIYKQQLSCWLVGRLQAQSSLKHTKGEKAAVLQMQTQITRGLSRTETLSSPPVSATAWTRGLLSFWLPGLPHSLHWSFLPTWGPTWT